jgi:glucose/arabinose dehydrogenase
MTFAPRRLSIHSARTVLWSWLLWIGLVPGPATTPDAEPWDEFARPSTFQPAPPPAHLPLRLQLVASGLDQPLYVTAPPAGPRLFIVERPGLIRVLENGTLRDEPFLDLRARLDPLGERGLLGLAFPSDYARSGRFYVAYSEKGTTATVIARFRAQAEPPLADPASGEEILRIEQVPEHFDHKAGWIGFRPGEPDFLYIATGDGGGSRSPGDTAQDLRDRRGKILRVDVSGEGPGFSIPRDNPFLGKEFTLPEIWALGLRNPFRASFDRETGDFFLGDVGRDAQEEINFESRATRGGRNYGWPAMEGTQRHRRDRDWAGALTSPLLSYAHREMMFLRGCVIGGYVYRGAAIPELRGSYFFGDFTNARIYSLRQAHGKAGQLIDWTPMLNTRDETLVYSGLASFGEDADGELYVIDLVGAVFRMVRNAL